MTTKNPDTPPGGPQSADDRPHPAIAEFAERLRQLRAGAGSPSFRKLAALTHYSSSTCADATAGRRLPTEAVVKAFTAACGADPDEWVVLHRQAAQASATPNPPLVSGPMTDLPARRRPWVVATASLVLGIAVGGAMVALLRPDPSAATRPSATFTRVPSPAPTARVSDGADPAAAGCTADAKLIDKSPVLMDGHQVGALELLFSVRCGAGWARIFLYPGQPTMLGDVTVASDDQRSSEFADPLIKSISDYTNVIVPAPGGCLSARAVFYRTGKPPAPATIPCQAAGGS